MLRAISLAEMIGRGEVSLGRREIISSDTMDAIPGDYPVYSSSARGTGEFGRYGEYMFDEELITWSVDGGGKPFYRSDHRFSVTNVCGYLRIKDHSKWHYRYLHAAMALQHAKISFDYQMKAHPSVIKKRYSFIPLPIVNQQRIAEILTTIDEAIEQTEALIAKTQQIKAGLMHDLFTRGVTPDGQLRPPHSEAPQLYKESPLGWIAKEWETVLLDDIALRGSGHTPNKHHPEYWSGGVKWVSLADSWRLDRVHISDTDHEISQLGIENSSALQHPSGVVVLSRDAGVGKSAVTTCEMAVSQHFMCWRCSQRLNNYYLYYWLQNRKWEFENIATGSTIPTIGLRFFKHYRISVPVGIDEQVSISSVLLATDDKVFALEDDLRKLQQLKRGIMHDLLTGHVRVPTIDAKIAVNV